MSDKAELEAKVIELAPRVKEMWDEKGTTEPPKAAVNLARRYVQVKAS